MHPLVMYRQMAQHWFIIIIMAQHCAMGMHPFGQPKNVSSFNVSNLFCGFNIEKGKFKINAFYSVICLIVRACVGDAWDVIKRKSCFLHESCIWWIQFRHFHLKLNLSKFSDWKISICISIIRVKVNYAYDVEAEYKISPNW